jgi:hypothetical protein
LKLWSFKRTVFGITWTTTDTAFNANASKNKFLKKAHPQKNSLPTHKTHFHFFATHKPTPKK